MAESGRRGDPGHKESGGYLWGQSLVFLVLVTPKISLPVGFVFYQPAPELSAWYTAISGDLLSAVISIRCILGFRKDNPNVFNMLVQNLPITSGIKCICC